MAAPSRVLLLPACPGPALPVLLLLSHGMHTHWYFSKAVYRASQRFSVVAGITVVRAFQYSESFESSRTTFSNFTGSQESLKVKSTGTIALNLISPGPPSSAPHRLTVTFIRSWKSLRNNTRLSIKVPDPWCCCLRYEGVSSTPFLSISLPHWLYSSLLCPFLPWMQPKQLLKPVISSPHTPQDSLHPSHPLPPGQTFPLQSLNQASVGHQSHLSKMQVCSWLPHGLRSFSGSDPPKGKDQDLGEFG